MLIKFTRITDKRGVDKYSNTRYIDYNAIFNDVYYFDYDRIEVGYSLFFQSPNKHGYDFHTSNILSFDNNVIETMNAIYYFDIIEE